MKKIFSAILGLGMMFSVLAGGKQDTAVGPEVVRIGVMPDAGALPLFLMEGVETVPFMSARERDTALQLGELDGLMTDLVSVVSFGRKGMPLKVLTITESRFLLVAHPDFREGVSGSVGFSENTIIEFMVDQLAGEVSLEKVAVPQVPVRMEMLRNGKVDTACLTDAMAWPLLSEGFPILRDQRDTGLEPAVLAFSAEFAAENPALLEALTAEWDRVVAEINGTPEEYRSLLLEEIRLPDDPEHPYPVPVFRSITLPPEETVETVLEWFTGKYGEGEAVEYSDLIIRPGS